MLTPDSLSYIQAFSKIIGVRESDAVEYAERKGVAALLDNATELLATETQRAKHQAFLDVYRLSGALQTRNPVLDSPEKASGFFYSVIREIHDKECLVVAFLDVKLRVKAYEIVSVGAVNESIAHPREVFRGAIINKATSIIICHNHPSGEVTPSQQDIQLTQRMKEAGKLLGIQVIDHVIITGTRPGACYSFAEQKVLEKRDSYRP